MRLILAAILISVLFLAGCKTTEYRFDTVIDENGRVFRETTFEVHSQKKVQTDPQMDGMEAAGDEEAMEQEAFDSDMVLPIDKERFTLIDSKQGYWRGKWRSDGKIYTDLRYELKMPDVDILPYRKGEVRYAYNDGRVIVRDFVLVKTITYMERFNDFFTKDEERRNLDFATDIAAELFLQALGEDLGDEYRLDRINSFVRKELMPVVKRWNSEIFELVQEYPEVAVGFRGEGEEDSEVDNGPGKGWEKRGAAVPDLFGKIAYDAFKLGITEDFDGNLSVDDIVEGDPMDFLAEWAVIKMCGMITSKSTGEGISEKVLRTYLREELGDSLTRLVEKRYGSEENFDELMSFLLGSVGYKGFPFDTHSFEVSLSIPGTLLGVFPAPEGALDDIAPLRGARKTADGNNIIMWEFSQCAFCPDGTVLSATVVLPNEENQIKIFGKVVLDTEEKQASFDEGMRWKKAGDLSYALSILDECLKDSSITQAAGEEEFDKDEMEDESFVDDLLRALERKPDEEEEKD